MLFPDLKDPDMGKETHNTLTTGKVNHYIAYCPLIKGFGSWL